MPVNSVSYQVTDHVLRVGGSFNSRSYTLEYSPALSRHVNEVLNSPWVLHRARAFARKVRKFSLSHSLFQAGLNG
jgi:hypothetical protein